MGAAAPPRDAAGVGASERPLRADAQRTRRRVMDAAEELYAERGLQVGFDEIARHAGVGVGTVYRRFPDRQSLVEALFTEKMQHVLELVSLSAEIADPWDAVASLCERLVDVQQRDRGLTQVVADSGMGEEQHNRLREQMSAAMDKVLDRAQRAGAVRADLETVDLVLWTHLCSRLAVGEGTEVWRRYLGLFLDAIREPPGAQALPGPVPTIKMFEEIAQRL